MLIDYRGKRWEFDSREEAIFAYEELKQWLGLNTDYAVNKTENTAIEIDEEDNDLE